MRVDIFGGEDSGRVHEFLDDLEDQCVELGIELETAGRGTTAPGSRADVTVVFADKQRVWTSTEEQILDALVAAQAAILPVIDTAKHAKYIPGKVRQRNAFQTRIYGSSWTAGLVDEVLSKAWLRRDTRKIFISYKRTDSECIATQVFDTLTSLGCECFLDDVSIRKGVDFQRELIWWLNDADLLLVLLSPNYPSSRWCMEEIAFAQARFIGILTVEWPSGIYGSSPSILFPGIRPGASPPVILQGTTEDQRIKLALRDFEGGDEESSRISRPSEQSLRQRAIDRIVAGSARQRAVAIRQRLDNLIPLARTVLPAKGPVSLASTFGDLTFVDERNQRNFVRVLPFRPDPESIRRARTDAQGYQVAGCLYSECDPKDARAEALRWLANRPHNDSSALTRLWACIGDKLV